MAEASAAAALAAQSPSAAETLAAMRRALLRSGDRFALFVAVSNSPARSRELIQLLGDAVPGVEVVELPPETEDPLAALVDRVRDRAGAPLMVLGLENSLATDQINAPLLRVLNMQRERWPQSLSRPVVLWVPEFVLELLGRSAPDFLDWRSDTFHFAAEAPGGGGGGELRALDGSLWKGGLDEGLPEPERRRRIEELRSRLASTEGAEDRRVLAARAWWLHELGIHLWRLGHWKEAEEQFRVMTKIADLIGHQALLAVGHHALGNIAESRGDYDEAQDWYHKTLAIAEELGNRAGMSGSYHQLGIVAQQRGEYDEAIDWYRKSLAILQELGDRTGMARTYHQLGRIAEERGDYDEALDWYRKSLAIKEELGDRAGMARTYQQLGIVAEERGDYDEALDWNRRSLAIKEELGDRAGMAKSYHLFGILTEQRGAYAEALDWYHRSIAIKEELGDRAGMASSHGQLGVLWTRRGDPEKAVPFSLDSLRLHLELRSPRVCTDLHWLRLQRSLLGEERFRQIAEQGPIPLDLLDRVLAEEAPAESPLQPMIDLDRSGP